VKCSCSWLVDFLSAKIAAVGVVLFNLCHRFAPRPMAGPLPKGGGGSRLVVVVVVVVLVMHFVVRTDSGCYPCASHVLKRW
jgi:hypothetical protein